jgi:phenylphosphate carboxylase alpha subunit
MAFDDLRDYLHALRAEDELYEIDAEVDWDIELGAICRRAIEKDERAVWFKRIGDYPGHSAFAHLVPNVRAAAISLGVPADTAVSELRQIYDRRMAGRVPPSEVASGPCQTHVIKGDQVDLTDVPAPMLHDGDGGRYVGTWDLVVVQDPETKVTNWGVYRYMLNDRRHLSGNVGRGGAAVLRKHYAPRGEPMPLAIVIGADPLSHMAAAGNAAMGEEEAAEAGALRDAPVPVVKAVTSDLRVPAHAQMVIEGMVVPDGVSREGPYGEYTAYRTGDVDQGVTIRVDAITYRDEPIHTVDCTGFRAGTSIFGKFGLELGIRAALNGAGVKVADVNVPLDTAYSVAYVSVDSGGHEVAARVLAVLAEKFARPVTKIFLFDADVDVHDPVDVMHSFAMRCAPRHGILIQPHSGRVQKLMPYLSKGEREHMDAASVVFDGTWPAAWDPFQEVPAKNFFETVYTEETKARVRKRWSDLGLR